MPELHPLAWDRDTEIINRQPSDMSTLILLTRYPLEGHTTIVVDRLRVI